jgi:hypothetical protein
MTQFFSKVWPPSNENDCYESAVGPAARALAKVIRAHV